MWKGEMRSIGKWSSGDTGRVGRGDEATRDKTGCKYIEIDHRRGFRSLIRRSFVSLSIFFSLSRSVPNYQTDFASLIISTCNLG